jgi:LPS export ABC transporter protein LptC
LSPGGPARRPFGAVRRLLLSAAVAGTVLVAGLVVEQASRLRGGDATAPWHIEADLSLSAFEMEKVGPDGVDARLTAEQAQVLETNRRLVARGIEVTFYDREGTQAAPAAGAGAAGGAAHLVAETGEVDLDSGTVRVAGDGGPARLALADGTLFSAPALQWDPQTRTVRTEGGVSLTGAGFVAKAGDAVADVADQSVQLSGGVRVEWTP